MSPGMTKPELVDYNKQMKSKFAHDLIEKHIV
jgi:hypothetical protein